MLYPKADSLRSKKRKNRGFKDLETSSRKHRRADNRATNKQTYKGQRLKAGEKGTYAESGFEFRAGGSIKYH